MSFEPRIIGFLCNWCSYTGADLAGVSRLKTSPNIRIIRTMCSGRIDPEFILRAFRKGADGILVSGCHFGDCHYQEGNFKAMRRIATMKRMIGSMGINPERLRLVFVSASEADVWSDVTFSFTETVRALGPLDRTALYYPLTKEGERVLFYDSGEMESGIKYPDSPEHEVQHG